MQIEEAFSKLVINTGRIAAALEAIASAQGIVAGTSPPNPHDEQEQLDFKDPLEVTDQEAKPTPKKKAKKKAKNEKVVGKTDDDPVEWDLPGIRSLLHKLQEQENQAAVKSILKKYAASTLGQVDKTKYAQLATAIQKQLDD